MKIYQGEIIKTGTKVTVLKGSHSQLFDLGRPVTYPIKGVIDEVKLETKETMFYFVKIIDPKYSKIVNIWFVDNDIVID